MEKFVTKVEKPFKLSASGRKDYLKVFLNNKDDYDEALSFLPTLSCVKKANSTDRENFNMTIYPNPTFPIEEVDLIVTRELSTLLSDDIKKKIEDVSSTLSDYPDAKKNIR